MIGLHGVQGVVGCGIAARCIAQVGVLPVQVHLRRIPLHQHTVARAEMQVRELGVHRLHVRVQADVDIVHVYPGIVRPGCRHVLPRHLVAQGLTDEGRVLDHVAQLQLVHPLVALAGMYVVQLDVERVLDAVRAVRAIALVPDAHVRDRCAVDGQVTGQPFVLSRQEQGVQQIVPVALGEVKSELLHLIDVVQIDLRQACRRCQRRQQHAKEQVGPHVDVPFSGSERHVRTDDGRRSVPPPPDTIRSGVCPGRSCAAEQGGRRCAPMRPSR